MCCVVKGRALRVALLRPPNAACQESDIALLRAFRRRWACSGRAGIRTNRHAQGRMRGATLVSRSHDGDDLFFEIRSQ